MTSSKDDTLSKVPAITLMFWIIKVAATTLGETGGDAVSMSMNLNRRDPSGVGDQSASSPTIARRGYLRDGEVPTLLCLARVLRSRSA